MELQQFLTFPVIFTFLLFLLILVKQSKKSKSSPLPPGPSKLPIIGHLHHLRGLPHRVLDDLAKIHGPLMHLQLGEISTIVVSSPSVVKPMMSTHDLMFVNRPMNLSAKIISYDRANIIAAQYGEYWRQFRKICILELLSVKRVQSYWSEREELVSNLIDNISLMAGKPMNLSQRVIQLTNDITCKTAFGKKCRDGPAFLALMKDAIRLSMGMAISDLFPSLKFLEVFSGIKRRLDRFHSKVDLLLDDIIRDHKENRLKHGNDEDFKEDLVDVLLRLQESSDLDFPITIDNVKAVVLDIFSAGSDSSSTVIEWAFSELIRQPKLMEKAQAEVRRVFKGKKKIDPADLEELDYMRLVIKETLRLHPPGPLLIPRECRETCILEGYEILQGTKVLVNAWSMGRDPENWKDPLTFDPERFSDLSIDYKGTHYKYIPFGAGRRICPGMAFGVANVELGLALLLYHFDWKLANGVKPEELDMTEAFSTFVRRKNDLIVIPTPYNP